jgi:hypothetical protein
MFEWHVPTSLSDEVGRLSIGDFSGAMVWANLLENLRRVKSWIIGRGCAAGGYSDAF